MNETAITIHRPSPKVVKMVKWLLDNVDAISTDRETNQQVIEYIKILAQYGARRRQYIADQLKAKIGKQPKFEYDSMHMYIDDNNIHHFASTTSKQGECSFRIQDGSVYVFEGTGTNDHDSVPTTIISDRYDVPTDIGQYIAAVKPVANFVNKCKNITV